MEDKKTNLNIGRNVDFLYEIGSLKNIPRIWQQILGTSTANNVEHSFRVMMIALMISRMEGKGNEEKIMKIALFHDMCESRSVDIAFVHKEYVDRHEEKSQSDQLSKTVFEGDIEDHLNEYKVRESIESKIVKDADNLDCDLELKELEKAGSKTATKFRETNRPEVAKKLFTESAKKMWQQIQDSDPDNWHLDINNDWTKSDKFNK
jgi:putative hydrolase of HD superfamily